MILALGAWGAFRGYHRSGDTAYGFLLVLIVSRSLMGLLESALWNPTSFCTLVMLCGLVHLGLCQEIASRAGAIPLAREGG